jgi:hypothetical protein
MYYLSTKSVSKLARETIDHVTLPGLVIAIARTIYREALLLTVTTFLICIESCTAFHPTSYNKQPIMDIVVKIEYTALKKRYQWLNPWIFGIIYTESSRVGLSHKLIAAVIHAESRGRQRAVSSSGAVGLMQIMPFHHRGKRRELFNPRINIRKGCRILKSYLKMTNGKLAKALKYYNAGPRGSTYNGRYIAEIVDNYHAPISIANIWR